MSPPGGPTNNTNLSPIAARTALRGQSLAKPLGDARFLWPCEDDKLIHAGNLEVLTELESWLGDASRFPAIIYFYRPRPRRDRRGRGTPRLPR